MNVLLDTNVLIWILSSSGNKLGQGAKQLIKETENVYFSPINVLEIRIKAMLGKLVAPEDLLGELTASGLRALSLDPEHADAILNFPALARHDPFDRTLLAQATVEGMSFLTSDRLLLTQGLDFVIDARK